MGPNAAICLDGCADLTNDPLNCGTCGHECSAPGSNDCVEGMCACHGANHAVADECDDPTVCAESIGLCIFPDYGTTETCDLIEKIFCKDPHKVCAAGYCTVPDCNHPEECNGWDDDCDGHVDATGHVPGPPDPLRQECYTGDPSDIGVGICDFGEQKCYFGVWTPQDGCPGETLPVPEDGLLACDGQDNDCNDCVDDRLENDLIVCGPQDPKTTDITFMIDTSGSMYDKIAAVLAAIGSFGGTYQSASWIRWGIERISEVPPSLVDVYQALTNFTAFIASLTSFPNYGLGSTEPTYDAVYDTATGVYDAALGPNPSAVQIYVVFTDEDAQTLSGRTEHDVCQVVQAESAILVVFTLPQFFDEWDECAILYPLSADPADMTSRLDDLFQMVCAI